MKYFCQYQRLAPEKYKIGLLKSVVLFPGRTVHCNMYVHSKIKL